MDKNEVIRGLAEAIWLNADNCEIVGAYDLESQEDVEDTLRSSEICTSLDDSYFEKFSDYTAQKVDSGGGEGDGAETWVVFKVKRLSDNTEAYIEFIGRYSSWDSSYYHESYLVQPEEVMVIKWKAI